ncbi:Uncharacterized protein OBRU01_05880 [Operophtera brumata]|uniref:Uncharacterized protein n=1 Tax=Operophtera brumata TaxID=104452 RepID=A0A0L7LLN3_OPEBR|nr:Uncharacterized protein OBRU01_05880 [Operophtera brumata]
MPSLFSYWRLCKNGNGDNNNSERVRGGVAGGVCDGGGAVRATHQPQEDRAGDAGHQQNQSALANKTLSHSRKLKINKDKNHAFHNPALSPDEELSRRGYSMYMPPDADVESGRHSDRYVL